VSSAAITLYVASQRVYINVSIYFVIDSVRKLLDHPRMLCVTDKPATRSELSFLIGRMSPIGSVGDTMLLQPVLGRGGTQPKAHVRTALPSLSHGTFRPFLHQPRTSFVSCLVSSARLQINAAVVLNFKLKGQVNLEE
jgi:hypothetical protein